MLLKNMKRLFFLLLLFVLFELIYMNVNSTLQIVLAVSVSLGVLCIEKRNFFSPIAPLYAALAVWAVSSPFFLYPFQWMQTIVGGSILTGMVGAKLLIKKFKLQHVIHMGLLTTFGAVLLFMLWNAYGGKTLFAVIIPMSLLALGIGMASTPLVDEAKDNYLIVLGSAALGSLAAGVLHTTLFSMIGLLTIFVCLACLSQFHKERANDGI